MIARHALTLVLAATSALACTAYSQTTESPTPKTALPPGTAPRFTDSVARSEIRERAIALIAELAKDPAPEVRANAVEAAGGAPQRLEAVIASGLKDENLGVRSVAAMTVGRSKIVSLAASVEPLLTDRSPFVQSSAIMALAKLGRDVDQTPLAGLLLTSPDARVRAHAAFVLGEIGNKSAVGLLRQSVRDGAPNSPLPVQRLLELQVAASLARLGDRAGMETLRAALYPSRPEELEATGIAAQLLGEVRERSTADQLIYLASKKDETGQEMSAEVRLAAAGSLAKLGLRDGGFIAEQYWMSPSGPLRAQCASVFGFTGGELGLTRLETMMNDPEPRVRIAAAKGVLDALAKPE